MESQFFALIQTTLETIDPELLIAALTQHTRMPRADAVRVGRKAHGILGTRFSLQEATALRDHLARAGVATATLAADQMLALGRQRTVGWLDISDESLGVPIDTFETSPSPVPWTAVFVVHAKPLALLSESSQIVEVPSSIPAVSAAGMSPPATSLEFQRESFGQIQPCLALLALGADGGLIHIRVTTRRFFRQRMPWLAPNLTPVQQFSQMVGAIIARSPQAIISPAARKLAIQPPTDAGQRATVTRAEQDERMFQQEMNWLLQLLVLRNRG